jgi:hypothetical protein
MEKDQFYKQQQRHKQARRATDRERGAEDVGARSSPRGQMPRIGEYKDRQVFRNVAQEGLTSNSLVQKDKNLCKSIVQSVNRLDG